MEVILAKTKRVQFALALCVALAISACATPNQQHLTFSGQVLDFDTKQPIEGAFVLAEYKEGASNWAHSSSWCIATKGMYTGADGKFSFPALESNKQMPGMAYAIKPDHFFERFDLPHAESFRRANQETFSNRNIYLKRQDVAKPSFQHGFGGCNRPQSAKAVEATITFLEIRSGESLKYGGNSQAWYKESIQLTRDMAAAAEAKSK